MLSTDSSTNGTTTPTRMSPKEAIHFAIREVEKLPLRRFFTDGEWRAHYLGTIRMYADELTDKVEQTRTRLDRAIDELNGLYYMTTVAYQIAKIVGMDEEPQIIPQLQYKHGLQFIVFGDDVVATVLFRNDGKIFLTLRNTVSGIEPVTVEIGDEGLTPAAAFVVASTYFSPLTWQTTPTHLRWMWERHTEPDIKGVLDELGIDAAQHNVLTVPYPGGLFVEVTPH